MTGLDPSVVAAIEAGRPVVVADSHRATALRLAWARRALLLGRPVWRTPEILTFPAWLERAWRAAAGGTEAPLRLLSRSQQRAAWEAALAQLAGGQPELATLPDHAGALMQSAEAAVQWQLALARSAVSDEERLLVAAMQAVRDLCRARGWMVLPLLEPDGLPLDQAAPAPLFAGVPALSPWQLRLQQQPGWREPLLADAPPAGQANVRVHVADSAATELAACARWCRARLAADPRSRLLVVSAYRDSDLADQGAALWRTLADVSPGLTADARGRWLAVEGGEALRGTGIVADALDGLSLLAEQVETRALLNVLDSPYFDWGDVAARAALREWFGRLGFACWRGPALREALRGIAERLPDAGRLHDWLLAGDTLLAGAGRLRATAWAERMSTWLAQARFAAAALGSADQQRLQRWNALLDELATLDAVQGVTGFAAACADITLLAGRAQHQPASGDAAITLSAALQDPVCPYDGIWVLGLTEGRWPEAPRPDPYIALAEQRRAGWPESSARERRRAAEWLLGRWQARTAELWLSFAAHEGDLPARASAMLAPFPVAVPDAAAGDRPPAAALETVDDARWPPQANTGPGAALRGMVDRLQRQQECGFRAQAQARCAAWPVAELVDGVPARLRGRLLHALLQRVWMALGNQRALQALTPESERSLLDQQWQRALQDLAADGVAWLPEPVLARERERSLRLAARLLALDRQRPDFVVDALEHALTWSTPQGRIELRIDRLDRTGAGERVLIDYKSGEPGKLALHEGLAEPLQLAVYAAALAARGEPPTALAVASLKPARLGYRGVTAVPALLPGRLHTLADAPRLHDAWQAQVLQLLADHLAGEAALAGSAASCRHCHLAALCRRSGTEDGDAMSGDAADAAADLDGDAESGSG